MGVYDHPPPADCTTINSVRLADLPGTSVYLGNRTAALLTEAKHYLQHLLP